MRLWNRYSLHRCHCIALLHQFPAFLFGARFFFWFMQNMNSVLPLHNIQINLSCRHVWQWMGAQQKDYIKYFELFHCLYLTIFTQRFVNISIETHPFRPFSFVLLSFRSFGMQMKWVCKTSICYAYRKQDEVYGDFSNEFCLFLPLTCTFPSLFGFRYYLMKH